jgi:hypothetical protein
LITFSSEYRLVFTSFGHKIDLFDPPVATKIAPASPLLPRTPATIRRRGLSGRRRDFVAHRRMCVSRPPHERSYFGGLALLSSMSLRSFPRRSPPVASRQGFHHWLRFFQAPATGFGFVLATHSIKIRKNGRTRLASFGREDQPRKAPGLARQDPHRRSLGSFGIGLGEIIGFVFPRACRRLGSISGTPHPPPIHASHDIMINLWRCLGWLGNHATGVSLTDGEIRECSSPGRAWRPARSRPLTSPSASP